MINTLRSILIIYYLIEFEFTDVFYFMNNSIKNLFFSDDCRESTIIFDDFAAKLTAAMIKKRINLFTLSKDYLNIIAEADIKVA